MQLLSSKKHIWHNMNLSIEKNCGSKSFEMLGVSLCLRKMRVVRLVTFDLSVCYLLYPKSWKGLFINTQLGEFIVKKKLLFDFQPGFRSDLSTDSCLTHLTGYIKTQTSKSLNTGMLILDLQKAFDTVGHDILCKKLKAMDIKSVDWFRSYRSHRNQIVNVNDPESEPSLVTCCVPQGSILSPLLFLCYINDMELSISSECKLLLYADDSAILYSNKDYRMISEKLVLELEMCNKWLIDNKLSLHMGKTE